MSAQSPLISVPVKQTDEVDLATPVAALIRSSYGEDPKQHAEALSALNRARQDAVRGAGSDATARDLLYKWFHMLEMLELRFPELRVPFPWKDAFTSKPISQHSLAYEKASIIFNIAATLSSLASRSSRLSSANADTSTSDGLKLSFLSLRQSAGMLSYINDNFLHAPSTDMSKDVVRWLIDLMIAQAHEVLWEKTVGEGKGNSLSAKLAASAADRYAKLEKDAKDWVGKGIMNKSWASLVACKAKYFASSAQYYRALADAAANNHGACLVRLTLSETLAKEAQKLATVFGNGLASSAWGASLAATLDSPPASPAGGSGSTSNGLPSDAASMMTVLTATHLALVTGRKNVAVKDNDLIYHDILPSESQLPTIEPIVAATPISIQEIYASPDVQKLIGAPSAGAAGGGGASGLASNDLFSRLVPLGVHEAASMYSEEKASVARGEAERVDLADGELAAALEYMGMPGALVRFRNVGSGGLSQSAIDSLTDPGREVRAWAEEEQRGGGSRGAEGLGEGGVEGALRRIDARREQARRDLDEAIAALNTDNAECEKLRVRFGAAWKQEPAGTVTRAWRADAKSHREALEQASANDERLRHIWAQAREGIQILLGGRDGLEAAFAQAVASASGSGTQNGGLLDLSEDDEHSSDADLAALRNNVSAIEGHLAALHKIKKDRADTLADLRAKIQTDDISHLLILNRRAPPEAQHHLFAQELEKFKSHQTRLSRGQAEQERVLTELARAWKEIGEGAAGVRINGEWDKRNRARKALVDRLRDAKEAHAQARAGVAKASKFYEELEEVAAELRRSVRGFVEDRTSERERLRAEAEWEEKGRDSASQQPPQRQDSFESSFASMSMGGGRAPPPPPSQSAYGAPAPPRSMYSTPAAPPPLPTSALSPQASGNSWAPPPPATQPSYSSAPAPPAASPYDSLSSFEAFSSSSASRPPTTAPSSYASPGGYSSPAPPRGYGSAAPPPPPPQHGGYMSPPPSQQQPSRTPSLPPPPPQWNGHSQSYSQAPPPPPPSQYGQSQYGQAPPPPPQQRQASGGYPSYGPAPPPPQSPYGGYGAAPPPPPPPQQQQHGYGQQYGAPPPPPPPGQQQPYGGGWPPRPAY